MDIEKTKTPKSLVVLSSSLVYEITKNEDSIIPPFKEIDIIAKVKVKVIFTRASLMPERYNKAHAMMVEAVCSVFEPKQEDDPSEGGTSEKAGQ